MKTEVRERLFLPLMVPLGVLATIVVIVGIFAAILLWNTREGAVALALAGAGGILFAVSMLSSRDDLDTPRKSIAIAAGAVPVIVGGVLALTGGGVGDPAALNINAQPHATLPEDAPRIIAVNQEEFETQELTLAAGVDVQLVFENEDPGTPHNVAIYGKTADGGLDRDNQVFLGGIFAGPEAQLYQFAAPEAGEYLFICSVHPSMEGTIFFSEDSEEGIVGSEG